MHSENKKCGVTFWLGPSEYEQLNDTVDRTGLTRSDYLRLLVRDALNQGIGVALVAFDDSGDSKNAARNCGTNGAKYRNKGDGRL